MKISEKQADLIEQLIQQCIKRSYYQSFIANNEQAEQQETMNAVMGMTLDIELTKKAIRLED